MKKKFRNINVGEKKYSWRVKNNVDGDGSNLLKIWLEKKIILKELIIGSIGITPGYISEKIEKLK